MEDQGRHLLLSDCRVKLTARSGSTFTGFVHSIHEASGKIVLKKVTTAGSKLCGPQIFDRSDLINLQVLSCSEDTSDQNRLVTDNKGVRKNMDSDDAVAENTLTVASERTDDQGFRRGQDGPMADSHDYHQGDDHVLICDFCDKFYDAIMYIMDQKVVGVAFRGVDIGRDGTLSLIQVATQAGIFVFDILQLGKEAFDEGLQALLEASSIVKVIHDCRWASNMLQEKYNIVLANIFDTQVANAFVHKILHNGSWPHYVESLPHCLVRHLNLPKWTLSSNVKSDPAVWLQRPISANLLSDDSRNVSRLVELHHVLMKKLLYEFTVGVDIYLSHGQTESNRANGCRLPNMFLEIPRLVNKRYADSAPRNCTKEYQNTLVSISDHSNLCEDKFAGPVCHGSRVSGLCSTDKLSESKSSSHSNDDRNSGADSRDSNTKVCEHRDLKQNKQLQDGKPCKIQGYKRCNPLSSSSEFFPSRDSSSQVGTNNSHPNYNQVENILKNNRNVSDRTNCTVELEHKVTRAEKSVVEDDLSSEMRIVSPVKHVAESNIRRSKLWQAFHGKQGAASPALSFQLSACKESSNQLENAVSSSHGHGTRQTQEFDMKTAADTFQKSDEIRVSISEKSMNTSFVDREFNMSAVPPLLVCSPPRLNKAVNLNSSSSVTENHSTSHVPQDTVHEPELDFSSFVPAGFMQGNVSKRQIKALQQRLQSKDSKDSSKTESSPTSPMEDDFGCIPMQGSLSKKRLYELPLGETNGIGDLFSESECSLQQSRNPQPCLRNESSVEDTGIENTHQVDVLLKALKLSPISTISGGLLHKLLPPKMPANCSKQQL